jgi:hypothetical protein
VAPLVHFTIQFYNILAVHYNTILQHPTCIFVIKFSSKRGLSERFFSLDPVAAHPHPASLPRPGFLNARLALAR